MVVTACQMTPRMPPMTDRMPNTRSAMPGPLTFDSTYSFIGKNLVNDGKRVRAPARREPTPRGDTPERAGLLRHQGGDGLEAQLVLADRLAGGELLAEK